MAELSTKSVEGHGKSWTPSKDMWYKDGNVIIVAENQGFRVYRGILVESSGVFAATFEMPQSENAKRDSERYDGCPVVRIPDERAEDMRSLLKAMFGCSSAVNVSLPFNVLIHLLRLGHKYDIPDLHENTLTFLRSWYFPCATQDAFAAAYKARHTDLQPGDYIFLANTCLETDTQVLLPIALLLCAHQEFDVVFDGVAYAHVSGGHIRLNAVNQRDLARGKQKLSNAALKLGRVWTRLKCGNKFLSKRDGWVSCGSGTFGRWLEGRESDGFVSPMHSILPPHIEFNDVLCSDCISKNRTVLEQGEDTLWKELPLALGFPSWESWDAVKPE